MANPKIKWTKTRRKIHGKSISKGMQEYSLHKYNEKIQMRDMVKSLLKQGHTMHKVGLILGTSAATVCRTMNIKKRTTNDSTISIAS